MTAIFIAGILAALAFLILILKLGIRRLIKYDVVIDVVVSIILGFIFVGTMSGMMIALIAGIVVSGTLFLAKKVIPSEDRIPLFDPEWFTRWRSKA